VLLGGEHNADALNGERMSENHYSFTVQRNLDDFRDLLKLISPRVWGRYRWIFNCGLLLFVAMLSGVFLGQVVLENTTWVDALSVKQATDAVKVAAIVAASFASLLPLAANAIFKPKFLASNGAFSTKIDVSINEIGVVLKALNWRCEYGWRAITELGKGKRHFFLFIDRAEGILIPFSVFSSAQERDEFRAFVLGRIAESENSSADR